MLSSAQRRGPIDRRTRTPPEAPRSPNPSDASAPSSGVILLARPRSPRASFKSADPSPKNQDGVCRLGKVGLEVVIGAPAAGSTAEPVDTTRFWKPPYPSTSQRAVVPFPPRIAGAGGGGPPGLTSGFVGDDVPAPSEDTVCAEAGTLSAAIASPVIASIRTMGHITRKGS